MVPQKSPLLRHRSPQPSCDPSDTGLDRAHERRIAAEGLKKARDPTEIGLRTLSDVDFIRWWGTLGEIRAAFALLATAVVAAAAILSSDMGSLSSLSIESASLALGTSLLIFMVVRFGQQAVRV